MRDWVVIGSGFGGSVAALRLAEKGYSVTVLEKGRRYRDEDFATSAWQAGRMLWAPRIGLTGILQVRLMKHVSVIGGVGVGGGSLVYASTLYVPHSDDFYRHEQWAELADWRSILAPHYATAERMLGVVDCHSDGRSEQMMRAVAADLGVPDTAHHTRVGIFLGTPGKTVPDPYFGGAGPERTGCLRCGECLLGCRHGAKNSLVKNYLYLAERLGVEVRPERTVVDIRPLGAPDGTDGYAVTTERSGTWLRRDRQVVHAHGVVLAGGAMGTTELLTRARGTGALPRLSDRVGHVVRTNSEAITAVTAHDRSADLSTDLTITMSVHPDEHTHVTNNTYASVGDALALTFGPFTGGRRRILQFVRQILRHPSRWLNPARIRGWSRRTIIFTVMQSLDSSLRLRPRRFGFGMTTVIDHPDSRPASYLPIANRFTELAARHIDGYPESSVAESLISSPTTAHILGGAVIGADPSRGVVDRYHRVFGYRNFLVTDGSAVPANVGVNPSLTITAMAEEALSHIPAKYPTRPLERRPPIHWHPTKG
ncbi:FAD-dependent oxidoreductase [Nocardia arthritidis]|uniref:FAD-dependent oxidoreductase n=1 Tax=Nocardia arthritidis TaxID=228602 RepID=UPI000A0227E1|nr:GMC family oxidoreductase [Nocardia arthritidis]